MISFDRVSYRYPPGPRPRPGAAGASPDGFALRNFSLEIEEGELFLVVGPSGAGKSTLLRCLNGLVPHFYGGELSGRIRVAGHDPVALGPQRMSRVVGMVFQDPETQFVTDRVEDELAFGLENQALPPALMRKRVEEALDQLTIAHLRGRHISTLSGGEKQRVIIAAVLTLHPEVLVLDEPTSQLDPQSAEEVLVAIRRLNEDLGLTVVLAEHRLERVVQFVDRVLYLPGDDRPPLVGPPQEVMAQVPLAPPLATLGQALGWRPLPLTVKQARRFAPRAAQSLSRSASAEAATLAASAEAASGGRAPAAVATQVSYRYAGGQEAVRRVSLTVHRGEVVAVMGRNGSGKSTLLKLMAGLLRPGEGSVVLYPLAPAAGMDTRRHEPHELARVVGYVPQSPDALLFKDTVLEELAFTRQAQGLPADPTADRALLAQLGLAEKAEAYPRDLSTGERQRAALAAVLVARPPLLLLDEPTRGLDYAQKEALTRLLHALRSQGHAILLATHDVELAARCADRVALMGGGEVVVQGPTRQVMTGSLVFASQINKLYRDPRCLTVEDVLAALPGGAAGANRG
ncbi:MAG: ATP-binding cassette domain-containing protein [Anaerolineae bacterium]|nr:ATP-binding cassette domain-containing protein [Anaerolineae bacterium]